MVKIDKSDAGWMVASTWLSAIEESARDFHGARPKVFCERVYEHSVQHFLRLLGEEYGIQTQRSTSIKSAVDQYIQIGVTAGLFQDASEFEIVEPNPHRIEITVHGCAYMRSCQTLIDEGVAIRDLTCARIGCFRAAVVALAGIDCDYRVLSFNVDRACRGAIERV
jgi:hypothetical protein